MGGSFTPGGSGPRRGLGSGAADSSGVFIAQLQRVEVDAAVEAAAARLAARVPRVADAVAGALGERPHEVEQRVLLAVHVGRLEREAAAGRGALLPGLAARGAVEDEAARAEGLAHRLFVRVGHEDDLARTGVLDGDRHDARHAVELREIQREGGALLQVRRGHGLLRDELALRDAADRAGPVVGQLLERGAGGDAGVGVAERGIVDVAAGGADVLLHGRGSVSVSAPPRPASRPVPRPRGLCGSF